MSFAGAHWPLPEEDNFEEKEIEKETEEIEMRIKAFQVRSEAAEQLPLQVKFHASSKFYM